MSNEVEVAIVGAGAAGIAAARALHNRGRSVLLIEAMARIGGRAHSIERAGMSLDLGCGWLHSAERNPLVREAEALGLQIDRSDAAWGDQLRNLGFSEGEQEAAWRAYEALLTRLHEDPPASDRVSDAIAPGEPWRPYLDALSSYLNGAEFDRLSVRDFLAYDDAASERNWRVPCGYGALIARLGGGVPTALGTDVSAIDLDGRSIALATDRGTIRARAAIVTLPTNRLAAGAIRFGGLAEEHIHAAACLPLGLADKVFLHMARPEAVPAESHLIGDPHRRETGSYYLRPFGRPLIEAFFGGETARALEGQGEGAAAAFAIEQLGTLLGSEVARGLRPLATTRWAAEPTIGGSYSHALPGHAAARATLSRPIGERLFLAGEACSPTDFSTCHGAWETGIAAAARAEAILRPRSAVR